VSDLPVSHAQKTETVMQERFVSRVLVNLFALRNLGVCPTKDVTLIPELADLFADVTMIAEVEKSAKVLSALSDAEVILDVLIAKPVLTANALVGYEL